ncbi:hypothetical protein [Flavobacterium sp. 3HN19-14]|uniref:hypothetical protein n=1 Tax=Flavobacterium sp. 3HN19-14 TaxID=3448133 RepID=UPI003EE32C0B
MNWTELNTKDSIPYQLQIVLNTLYGNRKLADVNEEFEETDVIEDTSLPMRQLRLLTRKNENWRLIYKQGGVGVHYVYIQCKIKNDSLYDLKVGESLLDLENNHSVTKLLNQNKINLRSIKTVNK